MFKGGYHGRYAVVDLTHKSFRIKQLPENLAADYLGGRGIGTKLLYDLQPGHVDPLSPENNLIIFTGPLNGTNAPELHALPLSPNPPRAIPSTQPAWGGLSPTGSSAPGLTVW